MDTLRHTPVGLTPRPMQCIRETYSSPQMLIPALKMVGWSYFDRAMPQKLNAHLHPAAWEICYILRGQVEWWVGDQMFEVGPGQVFFTRPDEYHGGQDGVMHACELYWLQVVIPADRALPGLSRRETSALLRDLASLEHRIFPGSALLPALYERLLAEHRTGGAHSVAGARAALVTLLVEIIRQGQHYSRQAQLRQTKLTSRISRSLRWIEAHLDEPFSIAQLAEQAGLSVSQFRARFLEETGQSPVDYVTRARITQARQWLRDPRQWPVTTIAHRLGYSSSQYFATAFKKRVGLTPAEYRANHRRQDSARL